MRRDPRPEKISEGAIPMRKNTDLFVQTFVKIISISVLELADVFLVFAAVSFGPTSIDDTS